MIHDLLKVIFFDLKDDEENEPMVISHCLLSFESDVNVLRAEPTAL